MKLVKKLFLAILILIILIVSSITFMGYQMYQEALEKTSLNDKIAQVKKDENYITIDQVPEDFKNAIIAVEDHRFHSHNGIDIITTARSLLQNVKEKEIVAGGSTISQQLGRILYFTQEKRFTRKVAELFVAFDLEKHHQKEEILELYINTIYYGDGYYGVKEACKGYFQKEPKDMTLAECSLLAGLPNAPSAYSPTTNPKLAHKRQSIVLQQMVKYHYITEEQKQTIELKYEE